MHQMVGGPYVATGGAEAQHQREERFQILGSSLRFHRKSRK